MEFNVDTSINKEYSQNKRFKFMGPLMDPRQKRLLNGYEIHSLGNGVFVVLALVLYMSVFGISSFADSMTGVSDVFNTEAFIGNTKWLEKFNFVGAIVQAFISIGGWVAAIIVAVQTMVTLIYFGMPGLWDTVFEVKQSKKGLISYTASVFPGSKDKAGSLVSNGSDIIIDYLILLCPNVKKYSENADNEYESITTWFMGTFVKKCILLLAISMMINGSFMKLYMVIVDGIGVVAQRFVETDSEAIVNRLLNTGSNYEFSLGATGKGFDEVQGDTATKLYKELVKTSTNVDTDSKYTMGSSIENYVKKNFTEKAVREKLIGVAPDYKMTPEDWERVTTKVVMNSTSTNSNGFTISASDLGLQDENTGGKKRYVHVYFQAGRAVDTTKYFSVPGAADQE